MSIWNYWKSKDNLHLRKIKTLRGQKEIDKAISYGSKLIYREVEQFSTIKGKYCIVKNKLTGVEHKVYNFDDERVYSSEFETVKDWTYLYHNHIFPNEAAYLIPGNIGEGEIVLIEDLIENYLGYHHNQGESKRLKSCKAIWLNDDLKIQYDPDRDCVNLVG